MTCTTSHDESVLCEMVTWLCACIMQQRIKQQQIMTACMMHLQVLIKCV